MKDMQSSNPFQMQLHGMRADPADYYNYRIPAIFLMEKSVLTFYIDKRAQKFTPPVYFYSFFF